MKFIFLFAFIAGVNVLFGQNYDQIISKGLEYYKSGNYEKVINLLSQFEDSKDFPGRGFDLLGTAYNNPNYKSKDYCKANYYFQKAMNKNYVLGKAHLAVNYGLGRCEKDCKKAFTLTQEIIDSYTNHESDEAIGAAYHTSARLYYLGCYVEQNYPEAVRRARLGAKYGNEYSIKWLKEKDKWIKENGY